VDVHRLGRRAVPELYKAMIGLDAAVSNSGLDAQLQEIIKLRVAQMNGCAYCMDGHSRDALAAGERPERLHVLAAGARRRPGSTSASARPWRSARR
jgi:AhpD family alkylhydroperoxidase